MQSHAQVERGSWDEAQSKCKGISFKMIYGQSFITK
jgi:hypothetical protein